MKKKLKKMKFQNQNNNNEKLERVWLGFFFGAISIFISIILLSPFLT